MKSFIQILSVAILIGLIFPLYSQNNSPNGFQYVFADGGSEHSVTLKCDGTVRAWGINTSGQLGTGNNTASNVPVQVTDPGDPTGFLTTVVAIDAGSSHTLALKEDGTVWAWGLNDEGQLGNNTIINSNVPIQVVGVGGIGLLNNVTSIAAGAKHSLAILSDGSVVSWGYNSAGQLGNGNSTDQIVPVTMLGLDTTAIMVAGGGVHTLVLQSDGAVKSCGKGDDGQLGDDTDNNPENTLVDVTNIGPAFGSNVIGIAAGTVHNLAVLSNGEVWTWGQKDNDILGRAITGNANKTPGKVTTINNAIAVAAGKNHSIAMFNDSTLVAFGLGSNGQMGDGSSTNNSIPGLIPISTKALAVSNAITETVSETGGDHAFVLLSDNNLESWGLNGSGQLGNGNNSTQNSPVAVSSIELGILVADAGSDQSYCTGDSVQIGGESPGDYTYSYSWIPNTGITFKLSDLIESTQPDTLSDPWHKLAVNFSKEYILTKTYRTFSVPACIISDAVKVDVYAGADASFSTSAPGCVGQLVNFYNAGSSGGGSTHTWDFGIGAIPAGSVQESPAGIVYSSNGAKTVTHTVSLTLCPGSDTQTQTITINPSPTASFTSTAPVCQGAIVDFTNTGTSGIGVTFEWDFGAGASPISSTAENPSGIIYTSSGIKTVTLTITNQFGCKVSTTGIISITKTPVADFATTAPKCTGIGVDFIFSGDSSGVSYDWNFGGGAPNTSTSYSQTGVTYATEGNKTITLIAAISGCKDTVTKVIAINQTPTATFTATPDTVCGGDPVGFDKTGSSPGAQWTYLWDFGDNANPKNSTSQENVSGVSYSSAGSKVITLTISDANCTARDTQIVNVNEDPIASFDHSGPECTGEGVDFTYTGGTVGATYSWNFDGGVGNTSIPSPQDVTYDTAGNKSVVLTITKGGCSSFTAKTLIINESPVATFTPSVSTICGGDTMSFDKTGSSPGAQWTYLWDFGDNANPKNSTSQENVSGVSYSSAGSKVITLTISDANCTARDTQIVNVNEDPIASFDHSGPECTGEGVDFTYTGGTVGATYSWNFDGGAGTDTVQDPKSITYASAGNKLVELTITKGSCSSVTTKTLIINLTPTAIINSTKPILCAEDTLTFSKTGSTTGVQWSYLWDFGKDGIPSTSTTTNDSAVVRYVNYGTKNITLTISDGTCSKSAAMSVDVSEKPIADFASTAPKCAEEPVNFVYTGGTGGISQYKWDFGDSLVIGSNQPNPAGIIFNKPGGNKTITFVVLKGSCNDTLKRTITIYEKPTSVISTASTICEEALLPINKNGSSQGDKWTYLWAFGDGASPATSTTNNNIAEIYYNTPGNKVISLTITDGICTETDSVIVTVNKKPVADFSSNGPRCTGNTVNFTYTGGSAGNWNYDWDFKAGAVPSSSALTNPSGIIYIAGSYGIKNVELIISNVNCSDTVSHSVIINETPDAQFSSTAPKCEEEGVDFAFTGITSGPWKWSYRWDLGEDAFPKTSSAINPEGIKYKSGGAKTITLTVFDTYCTNTISNTININGLPDANAGEDTTICAERSVQIGSASLPAHTYKWFPTNTLNNGTISNPVSSPDAPVTQYIVTVRDNSTLCVTTDTVIVTMLSTLIANAGPDVEICFGDSIQIGNALMEGQNYTWSPVDGINKPATPNPLTSPAKTTYYTITINGYGCDPINDEVLVTVHPLPDAEAGSDDSLSLGESTQLVATGGVMYLWSPLSGLSNGGIPDPTASPSTVGNHTFVVKVTDMFGCVNKDSLILTVVQPSVWFPNAFTPDDNGKNDLFRVRGFGIKDLEFRIFNRWGEVVFYTTEPNMGWDGTKQMTHEPLPEGAYVYYVKGVDSKGKEINQKGVVNLIR